MKIDENDCQLVTDICGHKYFMCSATSEYKLENGLPCPYCEPKYDFAGIAIYTCLELDEPGIGRLRWVVCGGCHEAYAGHSETHQHA